MKDKVEHTMGGTASWSDIIWASVYSGVSHERWRWTNDDTRLIHCHWC